MEDLEAKLKKILIQKDLSRNLPESAGVYVFFHNTQIIYIGKAVDLKRRVSSYFDIKLLGKTKVMVKEATHLSFIKVSSELEALLLEARLIRKFMPRYNVAAKDDKNPLYITITGEKYPRVITVRKLIANNYSLNATFGPFPSSGSVRAVLKMLRRIFPYSEHKLGKRGCLYSHLGLCNPCPSEIERIKNNELRIMQRKEYLSNIRHLKSILSGKFLGVRSELVREMESNSKELKFEDSAEIRNKIKKLDYITQPQMPIDFYIENPNFYEDVRKKELKDLKTILENCKLQIVNCTRIECYDIAHLAGSNPTASMVTFIKGEANKKFYRHFRIRQLKGSSDVDSLREVIKRRLGHLESWGKPDLIIVDGGKPQVGVFVRELEKYGLPVVGIAKRLETLVIPFKDNATLKFIEFKLPRGPALNLIQRIRDEAHRFARRYHHNLLNREMKMS